MNNIAPSLFRLVWWNHIEPTKRASFADDFGDIVSYSVTRAYEDDSGNTLSPLQRQLAAGFCRELIESILGDFRSLLPEFKDSTFEKIANKIVENRHTSFFYESFAMQFENWTSRVASLSGSLISSLNTISEEYIIWLKSHPEDLDKIHWQAFEHLTAEVLASHGFLVQFTGQVKNKSADILAIESNTLGVETKYLVECKRHSKNNKVDLAIVNAVLGAKSRAKVDHALLITTSTFTRSVIDEKAKLADVRLHLRDAEQVKEWLKEYEFKDNGLWLPDNWDIDQSAMTHAGAKTAEDRRERIKG